MANYLTNDTELTSIANAIRTKGGTSAQLTYPTGFVTAIQNIPSGGGSLSNVCYLTKNDFDVQTHVPIDLTNLSNFICMVYIEDDEGKIWTGGARTDDGVSEDEISLDYGYATLCPQGYDYETEGFRDFMGISLEFGDDEIYITAYWSETELGVASHINYMYAVFIAI